MTVYDALQTDVHYCVLSLDHEHTILWFILYEHIRIFITRDAHDIYKSSIF